MTSPCDPAAIADWLSAQLAALVGLPAHDIDSAMPLDALGITSMEEVALTAEVETRYGLTLPLADIRRHPTINELSRHIADLSATRFPAIPVPPTQADSKPPQTQETHLTGTPTPTERQP